MEKFAAAVDLDAVLDEFEFHEDQAEKNVPRVCPTDTGFFSPTANTGPVTLEPVASSPSPIPVVTTEGTSNTNSHSHRYDLPPPPPLPQIPPASQASSECLTSQGAVSSETIKDLVTPPIEVEEEEEQVAVSNVEEPAVLPGEPLIARAKVNDDYVDTHEVEEYLEHLRAEEDNYVDEEQVEKYLREISLEKSEQTLLEKMTSEASTAVAVNTLPDTDQPCDETVSASETEHSLVEPAETEQSPDPLPDLAPVSAQEITDLESNLEPVIASQPQPEPYVEEAEYVDLESLANDLEPQISREASPPPYSEVDPMTSAPRPTSLDLEPEQQGEVVLGAPGATPSNPGGPRGESSLLAGLSEEQLLLGRVQPYWVPDSEAGQCMICSLRFTLVKRRHHCRACGKVLCGGCCSEKHHLQYLEREGRVCTPCKTVLERLDRAELMGGAETGEQTVTRRPNPANPMEYCSTVPVSEQVRAAGSGPPPTVMVPVSVLKRQGGSVSSATGGAAAAENKSVMFSDGIRPGGDLTELDGREPHRTLGRRPGARGRSSRRRGRGQGPAGGQDVAASMMPSEGLPLVSGRGQVEEEEIIVWFSAGTSVSFVINKNMTVVTKQLRYLPLNNKLCWNFATRGLNSVGQDEVVILLEVEEGEQLPPRDVFTMLQALYQQAGAGTPVTEMGHISVGSNYLASSQHGGWLFVRHSHQTVQDLLMPPPPVLFGLLIMRWEIPWARVFPLRLMLRLGAEFRYYPSPLVSVRNRGAVYGEVGHTIMNVLSDFKNYTYAMQTIRGMVIHMTAGATDISIPKNRHQAVLKALNTSNETVLALGANLSVSADSHLVAIQQEDGSYQTQAINIQHQERKLTGASFVVFNGALKSSANLTAKSSIVEDGLMVQVMPDHMTNILKTLRNMEDHTIGCGPVGAEQPDEVVRITWVDEDKAVNIGIKSVLDGKAMDGITSFRIHSGPDMTQDSCLIRWTEVFIISSVDPPDPARAAEGVARAVCVALLPSLTMMKEADLSPLAVRVSTDPDNVMYEAGSGGSALSQNYMNSLDCELVPLLHSGSLPPNLVLELLFHILDH